MRVDLGLQRGDFRFGPQNLFFKYLLDQTVVLFHQSIVMDVQFVDVGIGVMPVVGLQLSIGNHHGLSHVRQWL